MKAWLLGGLLAMGGLVVSSAPAHAQHQGPFQCGTFCVCKFARMHFHGPLYNYGPYYGYYPFEPYGPWGADLRYNAQCGKDGCGLNLGSRLHRNNCNDGCGSWSGYARNTWANVFHRTHPCRHKAGCLGSCSCQ